MADAVALREELLRLELADIEAADAVDATPSAASSALAGASTTVLMGKDDDVAARSASLAAALQQDLDAGNYGDAIRRVAGTVSDVVLPITPMGQLGRLVGDVANTKLAQKFAPGAASAVNAVLDVTDEGRRNELAAPGVAEDARLQHVADVEAKRAANPMAFVGGQLAGAALIGGASSAASTTAALTRGAGGMSAGGLIGGGGAPIAALSEAVAPTVAQRLVAAVPAAAVSGFEGTEGTTADKIMGAGAAALTGGLATIAIPAATTIIGNALRAEGKIAKAAATEAAIAKANALPTIDDVIRDTAKVRTLTQKIESELTPAQLGFLEKVPFFGRFIEAGRAGAKLIDEMSATAAVQAAQRKNPSLTAAEMDAIFADALPTVKDVIKGKPLTVDDFADLFSDEAIAALPKDARPPPGTKAFLKKALDPKQGVVAEDVDALLGSKTNIEREALDFEGGTGDLSRASRPVVPSEQLLDDDALRAQLRRAQAELAFRRDGTPLPEGEVIKPIQRTTPNRKTPLPRGSAVEAEARAAREMAEPSMAEPSGESVPTIAKRRYTDDEAASKLRSIALEIGTLDAATLSSKSGVPSSQVGRVLPMLVKKAAFRDEVAAVAASRAPRVVPDDVANAPEMALRRDAAASSKNMLSVDPDGRQAGQVAATKQQAEWSAIYNALPAQKRAGFVRELVRSVGGDKDKVRLRLGLTKNEWRRFSFDRSTGLAATAQNPKKTPAGEAARAAREAESGGGLNPNLRPALARELQKDEALLMRAISDLQDLAKTRPTAARAIEGYESMLVKVRERMKGADPKDLRPAPASPPPPPGLAATAKNPKKASR